MILCLTVNAAPFWSSPNPNFIVYTNIPVLITTNQSSTNTQETFKSTYHTVQIFYTVNGTNSTTVTLDRTIDGLNWIPYSTNTFTTSSNAEYTLVGKWSQFRFRSSFGATNGIEQINYISQ
jgi:hypothetical protein